MNALAQSELEIQRWLTKRAAEQLRVSPSEVDTSASIMSLGIDSLDLICIAGELAEFMGRDIRAEIIWEYETIDAVSHYLADEQAQSGASIEHKESLAKLHMVRQGSHPVPIVAVGCVSTTKILARWLQPSATVLHLTPLIEPTSVEVRPIREIVEDYARILERDLQSKSVALIGFSFGGLVAYELACHLQNQGWTTRSFLLEPPRPYAPVRDQLTLSRWERLKQGCVERRWRDRPMFVLQRAWILVRNRWKALIYSPIRQRIKTVLQSPKQAARRMRWQRLAPFMRQRILEHSPSRLHDDVVVVGRPSWLRSNSKNLQDLTTRLRIYEVHDVKQHNDLVHPDVRQQWLAVVDERYAESSACHPRSVNV